MSSTRLKNIHKYLFLSSLRSFAANPIPVFRPKIASPRFSRKGEPTPNLDRKVKGRKGIGKFSGLTIGDEMEIVTRAQGVKATLLTSKELLLEAGKDIEEDLVSGTNGITFREPGRACCIGRSF